MTDPLPTNAERPAPETLLQDLQEFQAILDHAGLAILLTRNRLMTRANPRMAELFGWLSAEALTGQSARRLFPNDESFDRFNRFARPSLSQGQILDTDTELARADGTRFVGHLFARALNPAHPRDGTIWLIEDVTQKRLGEAERSRLLNEHRLIFDHTLTGIAYTKNRIIERCNARFEELFGAPKGTLAGQSARALFFNEREFNAVGEQVYAEITANGQFSGEVRYRRCDEAAIWCRVRGRMIDPADPGAGFVWSLEDITAQKEAEARLLAHQRQLESTVAERTQALNSQLSLLQQIIDAIPNPLFYRDGAGLVLGCNRAFERLVDKPASALIGQPPIPEIARRFDHNIGASDQRLYERPGVEVIETRYADPRKKRPIDLLLHKASYRDASNQVAGLVGVLVDVTDIKQLEDRARLAATVFDSTADGVVITDPDGVIMAVNRAFSLISGYSETEAIGQTPRLLSSGLQTREFYAAMWRSLMEFGTWTGEIWNRRKDGSIYPETLTITSVYDEHGILQHYVGVFSDITQIKTAQEALDFQAHHDALTGLPNRLLLTDRLEKALQRARRAKQLLAVLFIDLDRFKIINDTLGHHVGDRVLCEAAERFSNLVRESDTVARLGGDEFVMVIEGPPDATSVSRLADKLLDQLRQPILIDDQEFFIGASVGISLFPQDGDDDATLLKHADAAMYRAKERGRNTYEFFSNELSTYSVERFRLETDIRHAIERNELEVWFQPQFSLTDNHLIGGEALVRWRHPERGMVPPNAFIPLAEESGLIVPMGEWILRRACQIWSTWHAAGHRPGVLSVNVSGIEFRRGRVLESVELSLAETHLPPQLLELEITESAIMSHAEQSIAVLRALRDMGLHLAIDDFGTGYSSLAYLKRLPISKLKLDQSFVRGLPGEAEDAAIIRAILALARSLQLRTIAEGVETEAQRALLRDEGCHEMQGYLMGRPVPASEFLALVDACPRPAG